MNVKVTKEALMKIAEKRIDHILKANHDYGDAWQSNGPFTPLMRIKEKLIRVETLSDGRQAMIQDEKVETNVAEVFDYSLLWMLWHEANPDISKIMDKFSTPRKKRIIPLEPDEEAVFGDDGLAHIVKKDG